MTSPSGNMPLDERSQPNSEACSPTFHTIATLPFHRESQEADTLKTLPVVGTQTEASQLCGPLSPDTPSSSPPRTMVQVAASSPAVPPARKQSILASAMAPLGTTFRRPYAPSPPPKKTEIIIDSDDEGPTYKGGSSDSDVEELRKSDIKPFHFVTKARPVNMDEVEESPAKVGSTDFQQITSRSFYQPVFRPTPLASAAEFQATSGIKRPSDVMATAYGSVAKKPRQQIPSRAQPVMVEDRSPEIEVDDIPDPNLRAKVKQMMPVFPTHKVRELMRALNMKRGNFEDACAHLTEGDPKQATKRVHIDMSGSDDELLMTPAQRAPPKSLAARPVVQPKKPVQSIRDKWSTQTGQRNLAPKTLQVFDTPEPASKKKTLVRGRKHASSPTNSQEVKGPLRNVHRLDSDSEEADSGIQSASEGDSFQGRVLTFFNTCTAADLVDTAGVTKEVAQLFVSKRPFRSLHAVSKVERPDAEVATSKSKAKKKGRPVGESVLEKCEEMLSSYEAVDFLVQQCESMGRPIAQEIKSWGVNIAGQTEGQLNLTSLQDLRRPQHDSGIGTPVSDLDEAERGPGRVSHRFIVQPTMMAEGVQLKDYQIAGLNWLALLFKKKNSCILADDMGLGKTCQVIAFMAHLYEIGEKGPHLIVVPSATLENWLKEFRHFCPSLNAVPYYGTQAERLDMRYQYERERNTTNAIITTYQIAKGKEDFPWLRKFGFTCTVFDEGHHLKNAQSQVAMKLGKIESKFRLLLTGTPLQNNLKELMSLLGFLMPKLFKEKEEELKNIFSHNIKTMDDNHEALLSAQRIARARSMLAPFILRRKKDQVLKDLPKKERRVEYCDMTSEQAHFYNMYLEKAQKIAVARAAGEKKTDESANVLMKLRQAAIHSLLFRGNYKDKILPKIAKKCLNDPQFAQSNPALIVQELTAYSDLEVHKLCEDHEVLSSFVLNEEEWLASGKVQKMLELLDGYMSKGYRTLIFSQFVMVLDILKLVFERRGIEHFRLDGSTPVVERQDMIDEFCDDECTALVFMLSTKAGGAGINLARANKVIVFDSGFNPQDDIQAENRAHRIGQTREVEVVRLITRGTVEEQIYNMGLAKLKLDEQVAAGGDESDEKEEKVEKANAKELEDIFFDKLKNDMGSEQSLITPANSDSSSHTSSTSQCDGAEEDQDVKQEEALSSRRAKGNRNASKKS